MKDLNNIRFLFSEKYFAILGDAWSYYFALQQIIFAWYPKAKLLSIYVSNNFSQLLFSVVEPHLPKQVDKNIWTNDI